MHEWPNRRAVLDLRFSSTLSLFLPLIFLMASITSLEVLFLGTGQTETTPSLSCTANIDHACPSCLSAYTGEDERNIRSHTSIAVKVSFNDGSSKGILIDCGPTIMAKAALLFPKHGIKIDAVLITHEHYDAIGGQRPIHSIAADIP